MVGVGVGDENRFQRNVQRFGDAQRPSGRVLVQTRVNQQPSPTPHDQPHIGTALQVKNAGRQLYAIHLNPILYEKSPFVSGTKGHSVVPP